MTGDANTFSDTIVTGEVHPVDLTAVAPIDESKSSPRYERKTVIGRGGMGEVLLCKDRRLGREIAMKVLKAGEEEHHIELRFLREAYLQGQLEHPSIVPVYDLGRSAEGRIYFTMKRVRGKTLEEILDGLRRCDPEIVSRYSRRRLLTAFSSICLTIDFVHTRGVIHRDLKPSNLILGDFGEVYVLDWGIAKLLKDDSLDTDTPLPKNTTGQGAMMGTPGYMAPEQLSQSAGTVAECSDIYALGSILFEILTLEPLNPRTSLMDVVQATLAGPQSPSSRTPHRDIPPELDSIVLRATSKAPHGRYPTARALHEAIERFLDGDRDLEKRTEASIELTKSADDSLRLAKAASADEEHELRASAMRRYARALALNPSNDRALGAMVELILNPPRALPEGAKEELMILRSNAQRAAAKTGSKAILFAVGLALLMGWMRIKSPWMTVAFAACITGMMVSAILDSRSARPGRAGRLAVTIFGLATLTISTRIAGPFLLTPEWVVVVLVPLLMTSPKSSWGLILGAAVATIMVPFGLEFLGVWPESYVFAEGAFCVLPQMVWFPKVPALVTLTLVSAGGVAASALVTTQIFSTHLRAEEKLRVHEWYLRKLVPDANTTRF